MLQQKFLVRRGFTDNHLRELTINEDELKFEDGDSTNPFKIFQGSEIKDYRKKVTLDNNFSENKFLSFRGNMPNRYLLQ